jgi:hypothetical protein
VQQPVVDLVVTGREQPTGQPCGQTRLKSPQLAGAEDVGVQAEPAVEMVQVPQRR